MGWTNSHLHSFQIGDQTYSDPTFEIDKYDDSPPVFDERKTILMQQLANKGDALVYDYDFGDSWQHIVTVEKILPFDPNLAKSALCLGGARACPPEDCGGPMGFIEFLKAMKNVKHKEHESMLEWFGGPFDPAGFDPNEINRRLSTLKWPQAAKKGR